MHKLWPHDSTRGGQRARLQPCILDGDGALKDAIVTLQVRHLLPQGRLSSLLHIHTVAVSFTGQQRPERMLSCVTPVR